MIRVVQSLNKIFTADQRNVDEDKLASLFLADGVYQFGPLVGRGHDGIKDLREKLFANIPHRKHPAVRIYTFGDDQMELMVLGKVEYKFHEGHGHDTDWTGRYSLGRDEDGTLKFKEMQIIMVSAALMG